MAKDYPVGITPEKLKGTKTEQNLHTALAGESQAHLRYKWFEDKAKADGFVEVGFFEIGMIYKQRVQRAYDDENMSPNIGLRSDFPQGVIVDQSVRKHHCQ